MKRARDERGMVLVMSLLVLTLLSIVIFEFAYSSMVYSHLARNTVNGLQASLLARSGLNLGEAVLLNDADQNVDSFLEDWCPEPGEAWCRIDETQLGLPDRMRLRIRIYDEGGKLNLNFTRPTLAAYKQSLANPDYVGPYKVWQVSFKALLEGIGADTNAADRLSEYWDHLIETQFAAEVGLDPGTDGTSPTPGATPGAAPAVPQGVANQQAQSRLNQHNFPSLDDANAILGLDPRALQRLRKFVTALPFYTALGRLNANTAPREVLEAVMQDPGIVDSILFQRESVALQPADVAALVAGADAQDPSAAARKSMLGWKSDVFRVYASALINSDPVTGAGGLGRTASLLVRRTLGAPRSRSGNSDLPPWTLTRLDWQKEGGAVLFEESTSDLDDQPESEGDDRASF